MEFIDSGQLGRKEKKRKLRTFLPMNVSSDQDSLFVPDPGRTEKDPFLGLLNQTVLEMISLMASL